jgi:hypothetical protein
MSKLHQNCVRANFGRRSPGLVGQYCRPNDIYYRRHIVAATTALRGPRLVLASWVLRLEPPPMEPTVRR